MARFSKKNPYCKIILYDVEYKIQFRVFKEVGKVECFIFVDEDDTPTYRGISKCNFTEGDVFEETTGKRIAFNKALTKLELDYLKVSERLHQCAYQRSNETIRIIKSLEYKCFKNKESK
jgi:hypothetical protein